MLSALCSAVTESAIPSVVPYPLDTDMLTNLLTSASAILESDRDTARRFIQQAAELLRSAPCGDAAAPMHPDIVHGGLAPWQERRLAAHVQANIGANIRIIDLACLVHLSVGHFFRAFRRSFGDSPQVYVTKQRIKYAQTHMLRSRVPLSRIALESGFADQPHFTRVFRRIVGMNPSLWRRQCMIL